MVQKPIVRTWHREEFEKGNKENIPAAALAILEAEPKEEKKEKKTKKEDIKE